MLASPYDASANTARPHNKDCELPNKGVTRCNFKENLLMRTLPEVPRHFVGAEVEK